MIVNTFVVVLNVRVAVPVAVDGFVGTSLAALMVARKVTLGLGVGVESLFLQEIKPVKKNKPY